MRPQAPTLRLAAVIAAAALALHELRYLIGFGDHSGEALAARGHGYLPVAGAFAALLLALATAQLLVAIGRARRSRVGERTPRLVVAWLGLTGALLATYAGQELLEAALVHGRGSGLEALLADGGWSALPLATLLGAAASLLLRGASAAVALAAAGAPRTRSRTSGPSPVVRVAIARSPSSPLARKLASRAPPRRPSIA
jgi:hypothetical protein